MRMSSFFTKALLAIVLAIMLAPNSATAQIPDDAQKQVPTDSIVADFNDFVRLLEETHPDPYTSFGGRPFFRKAAMDTRFGLIQDSVTSPNVLAERIREFLVPLQDQHTNIQDLSFTIYKDMFLQNISQIKDRYLHLNDYLNDHLSNPEVNNENEYHGDEDNENWGNENGLLWENMFKMANQMYKLKQVPISFKPFHDGAFVNSISSDYRNLLGSRLIAIENIPIKEICDNLAKYNPAENEIGRIVNLCNSINRSINIENLGKAIPNLREDSITFQILNPEGKQMALTLPLSEFNTEEQTSFNSISSMAYTNDTIVFPLQSLQYMIKNPCYLFVDDTKNIMYFLSSQIIARDIYEQMDPEDDSIDYEKYGINREQVANLKELFTMLPSFSGEFYDMLQLMKQNNSKNLIIDLRGNSGGFPAIIIPTFYQLWGDKYLKDKNTFGAKFIKHLSPQFMKSADHTKAKQVKDNINSNHLISGDYDFSEMLGLDIYTGADADDLDEVTDEERDYFISHCISCVKDKLEAQNGKPVYTPEHIYVLIDPNTFSAAFHYAFYLWKMGATIIGEPSKQAPNTFTFPEQYVLPRTQLNGSISSSMQLFLPLDDPQAKQFTPDLMPTYEDYKRYHFDTNTILLYALDIINGKTKKN